MSGTKLCGGQVRLWVCGNKQPSFTKSNTANIARIACLLVATPDASCGGSAGFAAQPQELALAASICARILAACMPSPLCGDYIKRPTRGAKEGAQHAQRDGGWGALSKRTQAGLVYLPLSSMNCAKSP